MIRPATTILFILATTHMTTTHAAGPEPILLWPDGAPGAIGDEDRDKPAIRVYRPPDKIATGCGVVICPGGGYVVHATDHEGHQVAKWFNRIGVAGFVLRYRLGQRYRHPAPLNDVQRAIRFVRHRADEYGIDTDRVGVMGFSAGGHLSSTVATHFDSGRKDADDPIDRLSCRPDFAVLGYPVVSFTAPFSHRGSGRNLLGKDADEDALDLLSNEKHVTAETPPTFLFHTGEDPGVPVENSLAFYAACRKHKVPAELHVYQHGPHGVGLGEGHPALSSWRDRLSDWMRANALLADVERAAARGTITLNGDPLRWGTIAFVPEGSPNQPVGWAMVNRGKFSIPKSRGVVVGINRVVIHNLGSVAPEPTIDDVEMINPADGAGNSALVTDVTPTGNDFQFTLE